MLEPGGFERMATLSVFAHGAALAVVLLAPGGWWSRPSHEVPPTMVITLGDGAAGPRSEGMTQLGQQTRPGSTVADTGVRGQGFGLSTASGSGSGSYLDVSNFCCPEYIEIMVVRIRGNWNSRAENVGEAIVKFTIYRDGSI